jgi:hypothetical protein
MTSRDCRDVRSWQISELPAAAIDSRLLIRSELRQTTAKRVYELTP